MKKINQSSIIVSCNKGQYYKLYVKLDWNDSNFSKYISDIHNYLMQYNQIYLVEIILK